MRNKKNRNAFGGELLERFKKLADSLGRQHRGGLIQDQKLGIAHQGADDFHALALAHGEVGNDGKRIDRNTVALT